VRALIDEVGKQYPVSYIATLFKNPTKSKVLHEASLKDAQPIANDVAAAVAEACK
jgi:hypothetical protein